MRSVLLAGCGNIGFRHLQALTSMNGGAEIDVVEPNIELHDRIGQHVASIDDPGFVVDLHTGLDPIARTQVDLAVVATTARHRRAVVEELLDRFDVGAIILEKVLFQTTTDLDAVAARLEDTKTPAWVNCARRTFDGYAELRRELTGDRPVDIVVDGRRLGLASNAVHFLDLAEYLNDARISEVTTDRLEPGSTASRRDGCVEIFGTLAGRLSNGADLTITSLDIEPVAVEVVLRAGDRTVRIDELARTIIEDGEQRQFAARNVSETPDVYEQVLTDGTCVLTPYADSARQHRALLSALRAHLGLADCDDVACPIS